RVGHEAGRQPLVDSAHVTDRSGSPCGCWPSGGLLLAPGADLRGVLTIMAGARALDQVAGGAELGVGDGPRCTDEVTVRGVELRQHVGYLDAGLGLDEPRVPGVEVVVGPGRIRGLAAGHPGQRREHLLMPARDVHEDLADTPGAEPDTREAPVVQPVDRLPTVETCRVRFLQERGFVAHGASSSHGLEPRRGDIVKWPGAA